MVKKIAKTYYNEDSLRSTAPLKHAPAKYGFFNDDEMEQALGCIEKIRDTTPSKQGFVDYIKQVLDCIEPRSNSSTVKHIDAPAKYGLIDDTVGAIFGMIKGTGLDKFCGLCDWMKVIGLASPAAGEQLFSQSLSSYAMGGGYDPFPFSWKEDFANKLFLKLIGEAKNAALKQHHLDQPLSSPTVKYTNVPEYEDISKCIFLKCNPNFKKCDTSCRDAFKSSEEYYECREACNTHNLKCHKSCGASHYNTTESTDAPTYYHSEIVTFF